MSRAVGSVLESQLVEASHAVTGIGWPLQAPGSQPEVPAHKDRTRGRLPSRCLPNLPGTSLTKHWAPAYGFSNTGESRPVPSLS